MSGSSRPCESLGAWHGIRYARYYPCGWRCDKHSPSALRGRPEPPPGPGWPIHRPPTPDPQDGQEPT